MSTLWIPLVMALFASGRLCYKAGLRNTTGGEATYNAGLLCAAGAAFVEIVLAATLDAPSWLAGVAFVGILIAPRWVYRAGKATRRRNYARSQ